MYCAVKIEPYKDKETEELKEQIMFLEIEISITASEIADIEKQIHQYEIRYRRKRR